MNGSTERLPLSCPRCGNVYGSIHKQSVTTHYRVRDSVKEGRTYEYVRIKHWSDGKQKWCKLTPEEGRIFLGLQYKKGNERFIKLCNDNIIHNLKLIDKLEQCKLQAKEMLSHQQLSYYNADINKLIAMLEEQATLMRVFARKARETIIKGVADTERLDKYEHMLQAQNETFLAMERLEKEPHSDDIINNFQMALTNEMNAMKEAGVFDPENEPSLSTKQMITDLTEGEEIVVARIRELIDQYWIISEIDFAELFKRCIIDIEEVKEDEESMRTFEKLFDIPHNVFPIQGAAIFADILFNILLTLLERYSIRPNDKLVIPKDLKNRQDIWSNWFIVLSHLAETKQEFFDKRRKLRPSNYERYTREIEKTTMRNAAKKLGVSSKQLKRFYNKYKGMKKKSRSIT